ncbi:polysaccharide biosynthesis protein [bacterium BMS3Abin03]|nr:polysaccharide biosynthesis protein [bacterium BMS3Abin03]
MFDKLKQLGKDTAIYGVSTMVGRFLNFLLIPVFTNIFAPAEYGIIQIVYAFIAIVYIFYIYGMDSAFLKFAAFKDIGDEKDNFSTPYISVFATSLIFSFIIFFYKDAIAANLGIPDEYHYLIYLAGAVIFLDVNGAIPFLLLRLNREAKKFSLFKILNICTNLILNLFLILVMKLGIEAILFSNIIASLVSLILLLPTIYRNFRLKFHTKLFKRLMKFGLPYLPAGLAVMVVQVIDVPILEKLTDLKTIGIYKANYKLGIFMMLFVNMFQYAWQPFFLQNAKEENAKEMFSKVLTYFTLVGSIILVGLSLFISDAATIQISGYSLIGSWYWSGLSIVPIILLAYLINGLYVIFSAGIYIEEKSLYAPLITGIGAVTNVVANFVLIPVLNIYGAALATLAAYLVMALGYYFVTQKFYKINYEMDKIFKIFAGVTLAGFGYYLFESGNIYISLLIKTLIFIGFIFYLYFIAVNRDEIKSIKQKLKETKN